jgi:hypothetical protein
MTQSGDFASPSNWVQRGNTAYEAGRFADAVAAYTQAERGGIRNGQLYYNLGNAYFKNGELGQAIANYRRAEMLTPRDPLVRANLEYVLARREDKPMQARTLPLVAGVLRVYGALSLNEWLMAGILLYTLACSLWILHTRRRGHGRSTAWLWSWRTSLAVLALCAVVIGFKANDVRRVKHGVVTVSKVDVTSGPGRSYTPEFSLHEGAEVRIEERRPDWLRVSVGEKLRGWVPAASLVQI